MTTVVRSLLSSLPAMTDGAERAAEQLVPVELIGAPWWVGVGILAAALVALAVGWRMAVVLFALGLALGLAFVAWVLLAEAAGPLIAAGVSALAATAGALVARPLYRLNRALSGALLIALFGALPGLALGTPAVVIGGIIAGAVLGAVLGWRYIHHLDAIIAAAVGAYLIAVGSLVIAADLEAGQSLAATLALTAGVLAFLVGIAIQFRDLRGQAASPGGTSTIRRSVGQRIHRRD